MKINKTATYAFIKKLLLPGLILPFTFVRVSAQAPLINSFNTLAIFRNTSSTGSITATSFAPEVDFATGNVPIGIAIADLDGDGKPDIVIANNQSSTISVLRNTSIAGSITTGSFAAKVDFQATYGCTYIAISDIDGDGKPDLVVAGTNGRVSIWQNTSTIGSITASSFASEVDIKGGGYELAVADLDGDGKPDIALANYGPNSVTVLRNTTSTGSIIDTGAFAAAVYFPTGRGPVGIAIGDLDGDGKPDLVLTNKTDTTISILRNTTTIGSITASSFAAHVDFLTGNIPSGVAIGDLNGDGKPDIVTANTYGGTVSVFRNASTTGSISSSSFAARVDLATTGYTNSVAIGDLDGDGKPDIAAAVYYSVSVLRNNPVFSKIATLKFLTISNGTLTPAFDTGTFTYADTVANAVTSVTVTPTVTDTTATIAVNGVPVISGAASGSIPLAVGSNTVTVIVTAQDGVTTDTYTLTVIRAASSDATLVNLTVSEGTLSPIFASSTTAYADTVSYLVTTLMVTPTTNNNFAIVTINGIVVASGTPSNAIPLVVGENTVTVIVTAQDGQTTETYTISVYRGEATTDIYVPNAFTPNGDGKNDQVHVHGANIKSMKFFVYDQWGALLFTSADEQSGWDGTYKGTREPVGVYVYYLAAIMNDGKTITKKGTITLLK